MFPVSAADSVSLAIERTREFLFRPFQWGTYLKLGLVAIITEGVGNNFHSSQHGGQGTGPGSVGFSPFSVTPGLIAVIVAAVLAALLFALFVLYLIEIGVKNWDAVNPVKIWFGILFCIFFAQWLGYLIAKELFQ